LELYDLKGSWVGRSTLQGGVEPRKSKGTMKDNDLVRTRVTAASSTTNTRRMLPPQREKVFLKQPHREALIEQMDKDSLFLQSQGIMDYSLLLGSELTFIFVHMRAELCCFPLWHLSACTDIRVYCGSREGHL
jgi:hypothetical protein